MVISPTGKSYRCHYAVFFKVLDGLITEYRFYEDRNGQRRPLPGKFGSGMQADAPRNYALGLVGGSGGSISTSPAINP